MIYGVEP